MRTQKTFKNTVVSVITFPIIYILTFLARKFFVDALGYEYLGLNGVFTTIIATLSVAELGVGTAVTYALFKPLSENDREKVAAIVGYFKRVYKKIAFVILAGGVLIMPFLTLITRREFDFWFLSSVFLFFLLNSVFSYFFTFNHTVLAADQNNYVITITSAVFKILANAVQIAVLLIFKNYYLYLAAMLVFETASNITIARIVKRKYKFLNEGSQPLEEGERKIIKTKISALIYHRVGNYLVSGTDNLIISIFLGVVSVGLYLNYYAITGVLTAMLAAVLQGSYASLGNLIAVEAPDRVWDIFKKVQFFSYMLTSTAVAGLFLLSNDFMLIWLGPSSILPFGFVLFMSLNFYIINYSYILGNVRAAAGKFEADKYLHIILAVVNLIISVIFVQFWGIAGVLVGTLICLVIKECIALPQIAAEQIFKNNVFKYFGGFLLHFAATAFIITVLYFIFGLIHLENLYYDFIIKAVICVSVSFILNFAMFFKTAEMKYFLGLLKDILKKIFKRNKKNNEIS